MAMITDDIDYLAPGGRSFTITSGLLSRLNKRSRVLEIACGKGEAACSLARRFGCRVEGFDLDLNMIEYAREKAAALGLSEQVEFSARDGRELDFGKGPYDMILAEGGALTYISREDGIKYCGELLKEGGYLALTDLIYLKEDVPQDIRDVYEEGVFTFPNELGYRELLEKYDFEIVHLSMVPHSAWDRYYMGMQRLISRPGNDWTEEFKQSIHKEIDTYYNLGGVDYVGYLYAVARLARRKRVRPAGKNLRVPLFGQWP